MKYLVTLLNGVVSVHDFSMTVSPSKVWLIAFWGHEDLLTYGHQKFCLMRLAQLFRGKVNVYKTSPAVSHILSVLRDFERLTVTDSGLHGLQNQYKTSESGLHGITQEVGESGRWCGEGRLHRIPGESFRPTLQVASGTLAKSYRASGFEFIVQPS